MSRGALLNLGYSRGVPGRECPEGGTGVIQSFPGLDQKC